MKATKLDSSDLMVGDWIMCCREPKIVQEIMSWHVLLDYSDLYGYNEIEPIPITPEILEKNGFRKIYGVEGVWENKIGEAYFDCDDKLSKITLHRTPNEVNKRSITFYEITFVHQLQHALLLLGITKEITL